MSKRPNFLFFMTDQHRADWLGCAGHPVLKTPHIDSIAVRERASKTSMLPPQFACLTVPLS